MSLFRDIHTAAATPASVFSPPPKQQPEQQPAKNRPSSGSVSRNDLFTTSWQPDVAPPRPLRNENAGHAAGGSSSDEDGVSKATPTMTSPGRISGYHANTMPSPMRRREFTTLDARGPIASSPSKASALASTSPRVDEFGVSKPSAIPLTTKSQGIAREGSPRTSSFFDVATDLPAPPPPAPRLSSSNPSSSVNPHTGSPVAGLSRSASLRRAGKTLPAPLPLSRTGSHGAGPGSIAHAPLAFGGGEKQRSWDSYTSSHSSTPSASGSFVTAADDPLSPLHQSPQLPPSGVGLSDDWIPPLPTSLDDIELRLMPNKTYLLGQGRYSDVYLGAYKRVRKKKTPGRGKDLLGRVSKLPDNPISLDQKGEDSDMELEVNEDGDGLVGGSWKLCAAKRPAADREAQTMGLREAFFLNRLRATSTAHERSTFPRSTGRARAVSPLRDTFAGARAEKKPARNGSVYIAKLIAVKEDFDNPHLSSHTRSTSDAVKGDKSGSNLSVSGTLTRQRSSTMLPFQTPPNAQIESAANKISAGVSKPIPSTEITNLPSFPSYPSLAQAIRQEQYSTQSLPSISRLVLVLEHAPLGTLDRLLRTSPQLVGKKLFARWAREATEGLEWVHANGVVHGDIKPGNILLTADLHIRISDFGSSLLIHPSHPPTDGVGLGTLPFSSPELVDKSATFSFPVDIWALGATLYQCITGREPYRGLRMMELTHRVKSGGLWLYEENERLSRVGQGVDVDGTPFPSAWREPAYSGSSDFAINSVAGIRRAGSLRVPSTYSTLGKEHPSTFSGRPRLNRMTSAESIRANEDATSSASPAAIKLWSKWVKGGAGLDPVTALLAEDSTPAEFWEQMQASGGVSRQSSLRRSTSIKRDEDVAAERELEEGKRDRQTLKVVTQPSPPSSPALAPPTVNTLPPSPAPSPSPCTLPQVEGYLPLQPPAPTPPQPQTPTRRQTLGEAYSDGSPAMLYLDQSERVSEEVRDVIKGMLVVDQWERLEAREIRARWDELGVGFEGDDVEEMQVDGGM
ncbi:hypothetical protein IAR50_000533 [Cryptococcus sp. DSM 104548]